MPLESCIETNVTEILVFKIQKVVVPDDHSHFVCEREWCEIESHGDALADCTVVRIFETIARLSISECRCKECRRTLVTIVEETFLRVRCRHVVSGLTGRSASRGSKRLTDRPTV